VCLFSACALAAQGPCDNQQASQYAGFKVTRVDISNPLGFIERFAPEFRSLGKGLKVKAGQPFSVGDYNADEKYLAGKLDAQFSSMSTDEHVKFDFARPYLEDCDADAKTLRVVYAIFTTVVPSLNPASIEQESNESQRPATTGAEQVSGKNVSIAPLGGYNPTRAAFGGLNFSDTLGKITVAGQTEDSANSQFGNFSLAGNLPSTRLWNNASLNLALVYEDSPAGDARFKEGEFVERFSASTKEFTGSHLLFRYGTALEGGHQQSSDPLAAVRLTPDSGYGSLKFYAGITGRPQRSAFSASYGLQLGDTLRSGAPTFRKHIVDLGYNRSFLTRKPLGDKENFTGPLSTSVHKMVAVETRFSAGIIQDALAVPLAERFFGGNEIRPFVQDDSWVLPGDAYIRSIPENRLGAAGATSLGGTRFYSANLTLAVTAWGKPFIPKELAMISADPGTRTCQSPEAQKTFPCILNGPFQTSAVAAGTYYKTHDKDYVRLTSQVQMKAKDLDSQLTAFTTLLGTIPSVLASRNDIVQELADISCNTVDIGGDLTVLEGATMPEVIKLLVNTSIPALKETTSALTKTLREASQTALAGQLDQAVVDMAKGAGDMQMSITDAETKFPDQKFIDEGWAKIAPGHRALDVLLNQLNIYSVAPVAIFDVARVWPVGQGVRYGIGPGIRLSLVNVNLTFGYAYNPHRLPSEKSGAIFVKMDITGLF
jgi:hypothetical protein